jgi:hypothetical protein
LISLDKFLLLFRLAIDDMDKQLLEIRKAWKELFDMDFEDFGHDIDLELWRCDEIIDWTDIGTSMSPLPYRASANGSRTQRKSPGPRRC